MRIFLKAQDFSSVPISGLAQDRQIAQGAIFLDVGSCLGNHTRKLVADGYSLEQVVTTDLHQEFGDLGHELFRTTRETYPIAFVPPDAFDSKHLDVVPPVAFTHAPTSPPENRTPDLRSLTSLNPLHGRVFAIHASSLFHFFGEETQLHLARALAGLLSPESGSVIFGRHMGNHEKGFVFRPGHGGRQMFCHSPESWTELWDGLVFEKGVVTVQIKLVQVETKDPDESQNRMIVGLVWSVTRL